MKEKARRDNWDHIEKKKSKKDNMKRDRKMKKKFEAKLDHGSMKKKKHGKVTLNCSKNEKSEKEQFNLHEKKKRIGKEKMNVKCASKKKKKIFDEESSSLELQQKKKMRKMRKKEKMRKRNLRFDLEETKEKLNLSFEDKEIGGNYSTISQGSAFFKIMLQSFKKYMFIPPSFAEEMGILVNQPIYLKHCNDRYWTVFLNLKYGCLAFRQGWHDFVVNHFIKKRELLVFTYEGDSVFTVTIFGVDCKERTCVQENKKGKDGKRKKPETQFEDFHCDKKQRNYETSYGKMGHDVFDSPKKKVPNVVEKATKALKHETKCNSSWKKNTNYKKKGKKATEKPKKDKTCSPKSFNGSKKVKITRKEEKKMLEKNANKHTNPNDGLYIQKDKKLGEGRRSSGKSKLKSAENNNGCQGTDSAPVFPLPINAFMPFDGYSCTSSTEKTANLNNLCCDFLVDEYGVCHNTDGCQMNGINGSMFHSGLEMKRNASRKDQIQLINCSKREAITNQNFCDNLIIKDKNYTTRKDKKDMACVSTKKPSVDVKHKNVDVKKKISLVPGAFRFGLTIPSRNDWITLPEKIPVPENRYGRRVIMLRTSLCKLWPVLYIEDRFFVGFGCGWKSFIEANCFRKGDLVEFMEFPGSQYTLQMV